MARPRSRLERYGKIILPVVAVVIAVGIDFAATAAYHLVELGTIHSFARRREVRARSEIYHHTLAPNVKSVREGWGREKYVLATNSLGFKDKAVRRVPLSSDRERALFIGDSFTEGVGHPYERTFVGLIDERLSARGIEVLNAGVVSYAPAIYFRKVKQLLETDGLRFDHLVVFLDVSDIEDEANLYDLRDDRVVWVGTSSSTLRQIVDEYTTLARSLWGIATLLGERLSGRHQPSRSDDDKHYETNHYRSLWTVDPVVYSDYAERGLAKAKLHMDMLHALATEHGIGMTLVVYPWPDQILRGDLDSIQVKIWREWAAATRSRS